MLWEMDSIQMLMSFSFFCSLSFICGWLADKVLGYAGFTAIGNWLLILVGSYAGLIAYNMYGYRFSWNDDFVLLLSLSSGAAMLMFMLGIKTVFKFH